MITSALMAAESTSGMRHCWRCGINTTEELYLENVGVVFGILFIRDNDQTISGIQTPCWTFGVKLSPAIFRKSKVIKPQCFSILFFNPAFGLQLSLIKLSFEFTCELH